MAHQQQHNERQRSIVSLVLFIFCFGLLDVDASKKTVSILPFVSRIRTHGNNNNNLRYSFIPYYERIHRGGAESSILVKKDGDGDEEEDDEESGMADIRNHPEFQKLQAYRMQQQTLLQLRATFLSEALAKRGLPIPTIENVATPEGASPPQHVDWDCAMSTLDDPKSCLVSFDAEPNTKVVAPIGSDQWISLAALNRLRRTDPSKVEPMWHSKYSVLKSWFDPESEYSLLQHVGFHGFLLNAILQGVRLHVVLAISIGILTIIGMPFLEYFVNRILVSNLVWMNWANWSRFVHAALPLKLLMGQFTAKFFSTLFLQLVEIVKKELVELECRILEQHIPLTVGVPTISLDESDNEDSSEDNNYVIGIENDEIENENDESDNEDDFEESSSGGETEDITDSDED